MKKYIAMVLAGALWVLRQYGKTRYIEGQIQGRKDITDEYKQAERLANRPRFRP